MSFVRCVIVAALSLPAALIAGPSAAETIFGAMEKAYANNPDLNAVRAELRARDENVTIAKAAMRPQISAVGSTSSVGGYDRGQPGFDYQTGSIGLTVTQQVFDGFQALNNARAAESDVYSNREQMRANEMSILLAAAQGYSDVSRDQQIVAIRRKNIDFLREQLRAANSRLDVGEGTRTDVAQAEAQLAGSQALLTSAIAQLKQSEAVYVQIVGVFPEGIKQPAPASRALPGDLDSAIQAGIREHPSVLASLHAVNAAGYQVKSAEGTLLPGVVIQGNIQRSLTNQTSRIGIESPDTDTGTVTAQVRVPIYQGGAEFGNIRKAKETLGAQRIRVDSARASVQQQITAAYAQMEAAKAAIAAAGQQVDASNQALAGVIEERNVGEKTTLDVLNAQQQVLQARENLVGFRRDAVVASYSLLAATGRLTVHSQDLQVAEYRAEEHFEAVKDMWIGLRVVTDR